ncbi:hypothetical protein CLV51_105359 [Chitinophaga niastensis]|uniref:Uncharacterized protein n=1 Tax=Chitinophaga niastensis TaxID=536980 RepID=A0A2P8HFL2_CHINA|nr:hypothetical protein [Chitinophaga niastensis]PSL44984.1 hypothetical protein CLV51_105359 [Chitinophaga niastensis]
MAKQNGIVPLKGTIGNITFYKSKAGHLARGKGGVDGSRIANDAAFVRTRENGAEFGRAGKAGKLLRTAFRAMLLNASDSYLTSRLTRDMLKVIQADAKSVRGQRNVIDGEAELLSGFEFNINARLAGTLFAPYTAAIDRATGILKVDIPAFIPVNMVAAPGGATHFKILAAGAEIDFEAETFVNGNAASAELTIDATATAVMNLSVNVTANSTKPLFLVLGVEFYQQVNGALYSLKNGAFNALALVNISGMPAAPGGV